MVKTTYKCDLCNTEFTSNRSTLTTDITRYSEYSDTHGYNTWTRENRTKLNLDICQDCIEKLLPKIEEIAVEDRKLYIPTKLD